MLPRRQWRNPVAEKTVEASQTPGRDGLYNTEEASAAKERARPRTRTRGQRRVEWLGPHNEGDEEAEEAEGRAASTAYEASTDTRECAGTTTNPRKFCPPFDIPPIPSYSSHRVLSETPPCVDPLSTIWVIHTHSIHICTHMLSYAFICTSYALIWTNRFTTRLHMYP